MEADEETEHGIMHRMDEETPSSPALSSAELDTSTTEVNQLQYQANKTVESKLLRSFNFFAAIFSLDIMLVDSVEE